MYGGLLNKAVFLHLVCQKSRQGSGVSARWVSGLMQVCKSTALTHLEQLCDDGDLVRDELPWRTNAKKFFFRPSARTEANWLAGVYKPDYLVWIRAMMEA